jgi:hypothetical protein
MRANPIQASFTAGEVSPMLYGRVDTQKYASGCAKLKNLIVKPQGPCKRRPGTEYYVNAAEALLPTRLIPFNNTFVVELHDSFLTLRSKSLGTPYGTDPVQLASPYVQSDLWDVTFDVAGNIMYLAHGNHPPMKLWNPYDFRGEPRPAVAPYGWELESVLFIDGPYFQNTDADSIRLTVSNMTDTATLRSTSNTEFSNGNIGRYVEFMYENEWRLAKIVSVPVSPGPTAVVDIVENVLIFLDPNVRIAPKAENTATDSTNTSSSNPAIPNRNGIGGGLYLPAGSDPRYAQNQPQWRNYLDRRTPLTGGGGTAADTADIKSQGQIDGTLNSTHSQVFSRADVGKFIRRGTNLWRLITAFKSDSAVTYNNGPPNNVEFKVPTGTLSIDMKSRLIAGTLTATLPVVGGPAAPFYNVDIGRHIRLNYSGHQIWGMITGYTSPTVVSIKFFDPFPRSPQDARNLANNGITDLWRWGSWSQRTGFPAVVCIHEQRLMYAATRTEPQTFWASCSQDFERMAPTEFDSIVLDSNGFSYLIASSQPQEIMWMAPGPVLMIGTRTGEWQIKSASSISEPLTATNIVASQQTPHGSSSRTFVKIDSSVIHIDRTGRCVRELTFSFEQDSWVSRDLTIVSEHILRDHGGAKEIVYQQTPNSVLWVRLNDGSLAAMTYVRDQEVVGWHWHTFEDNDNVLPIVHSVMTIQSAAGTEDRVFMCLQRTINGNIVYYLEAFADEFFPTGDVDTLKDKIKHVDCSKTIVTPGTDLFVAGLTHLAGETVWASKDGAYLEYRTFTVNGAGQMDTTPLIASGTWVVGLPMNSRMKTLPPEGGSQFGTSQGKIKKIPHLDVRFSYSHKVKHGVDAALLKTENLTGPFLQALEDKRFSVEGQWGPNMGYFLESVGPNPLTIVALMPVLHTTQ